MLFIFPSFQASLARAHVPTCHKERSGTHPCQQAKDQHSSGRVASLIKDYRRYIKIKSLSSSIIEAKRPAGEIGNRNGAAGCNKRMVINEIPLNNRLRSLFHQDGRHVQVEPLCYP